MSSSFSLEEEENNEVDGYNPASAHYVTALPSGVLSFHFKKLKNLDEARVAVSNPELYLRIRIGTMSKCTKNFHWTMGSKYVIIHDIKHFSLMVSRVRSDPANDIRIDLVLVETAHVHRIIAHKDLHLYDVIKNLYLAGTYELKYRTSAVAVLEFESCFAYGIFGYGYSHQLQNRQRKMADTVSHSFFFRPEPPLNRKQYNNLSMAPVPMEHPAFLSFAKKVDIGSPAVREALADRYTKYDLEVFSNLEKHEPVILARTMKRRLHAIQEDFSALTSRQQRTQFLEKLILRHEGEGGSGQEDQAAKDKGAPGSVAQSALHDVDHVAAPASQAYGEDDDHACVTDVPELTAFLASAPGIQTRARYDRRQPSMSILEEDEMVTEFEDRPSVSTDHVEQMSSVMTSSVTSSISNARRVKETSETTRRSTLAELPGGRFMISFANKLGFWRSKGPAPQ